MNLLRQILKRESEQPKPEPHDETPAEPTSSLPPPTTSLRPSPHDIQIGLASDPGRVRDHNEDACLAWQFVLAQQGEPPAPMGLFIMADGMGGQVLGEQASALATRTAAQYIIRHIALPQLSDDTTDRPPIHEVLSTSVRLAHRAIIHRYPEAGTTMTLALMLGDNVYIGHVGDSRAYLGQRGRIELLTTDHSLAARLLELGQVTPEEAAQQRNMLYRALGQGARVEPDILDRALKPGQYLLLCCDGLWGTVSDADMTAIIDAAPTPDLACQKLVAQANQNGGEDNISAILVARGWPLPAGRQPRPSEPVVYDSRLNNDV